MRYYFLNYVYPNPPCQLSLWETGAPGENPRLLAEQIDGLFSHESAAGIETTISEVKGPCSVDYAIAKPRKYITPKLVGVHRKQ